MSLQSLMNSVCTVERNVPVETGASGFKKTNWQTIHFNCPCRIQPYRAERVATFKKLGMEVTHRIHFVPPIDDIAEGDRVVFGDKIYSVSDSFDPDLLGWFTVVDAKKLS